MTKRTWRAMQQEERIAYLLANRATKTAAEMAAEVGAPRNSICSYAHSHGVSLAKPRAVDGARRSASAKAAWKDPARRGAAAPTEPAAVIPLREASRAPSAFNPHPGNIAKRAASVVRDEQRRAAGTLVVPPDPPKPPTFRQIGLLELRNDTCRFPIGDPREPGFGFCGAPQADAAAKRVYCPYHQALSWVPAGQRKAAEKRLERLAAFGGRG